MCIRDRSTLPINKSIFPALQFGFICQLSVKVYLNVSWACSFTTNQLSVAWTFIWKCLVYTVLWKVLFNVIIIFSKNSINSWLLLCSDEDKVSIMNQESPMQSVKLTLEIKYKSRQFTTRYNLKTYNNHKWLRGYKWRTNYFGSGAFCLEE